jgi:hypothetical protein
MGARAQKTPDTYDVFCVECGTEGEPMKINVEPLRSGETIALRDMHNKTFHKGEVL